MTLRAMAVSAPQFVEGTAGEKALSSADPASLFNACRYAAWLATQGDPVWANSNWAGSRQDRRRHVHLLQDLPEAQEVLEREVAAVRPNLVLIGAMTICQPGAIAVARKLKNLLGDDVCVVLGGRHVNETVFRDARSGQVAHHVSSPLRLMEQGKIPNVFDVVVSGESEMLIAELGRLVARRVERGQAPAGIRTELDDLGEVPGKWIVGTLIDGAVTTLSGRAGSFDYNALPSPSEMFGVGTSFSTFGGLPTAHVFSDIGGGCIYDCAFCSERISVIGKPRQFSSSARRMHYQLKKARETILEDDPAAGGASAFCEDSTFLGWNTKLVDDFVALCEQEPLNMRFGGQATIDQILRFPELAPKLSATGLEYLFIGLETPVPEVIGGIHKDIGGKDGSSWLERADQAVNILRDAGIVVTFSLLFGLGERRQDRELLFDALRGWGRENALDTISMNWAVQHPLMNMDAGCNYEYLDWAIEPGPMLPLLKHFGEASTCYPSPGSVLPTEDLVTEIIEQVDDVLQRKPAAECAPA